MFPSNNPTSTACQVVNYCTVSTIALHWHVCMHNIMYTYIYWFESCHSVSAACQCPCQCLCPCHCHCHCHCGTVTATVTAAVAGHCHSVTACLRLPVSLNFSPIGQPAHWLTVPSASASTAVQGHAMPALPSESSDMMHEPQCQCPTRCMLHESLWHIMMCTHTVQCQSH